MKVIMHAGRLHHAVKIYNDNFGGTPKFMHNVFAGLASTRFHRPVPWNGGTRGLGLSEEAQRILRSVRTFVDSLDWFELQPWPNPLSHAKTARRAPSNLRPGKTIANRADALLRPDPSRETADPNAEKEQDQSANSNQSTDD